jgi:uncharacterized membrane protein
VVVAARTGHPGLYDTLVALHVICAVVGFGAVALSGIYGGTASHPDRAGSAEEARRYFRSPGRAEWVVLAVPFFGAGALGVRPGGADFGDAWVVGAAALWLVAAAVLVGLVRPAERRIRAGVASQNAGEPPAGREVGPGPAPGRDVAASAAGSVATTGDDRAPTPGVASAPDGDTRNAGRLLMWAAAGCDVIFVAALVLMIFQPA